MAYDESKNRPISVSANIPDFGDTDNVIILIIK